jgi:Na+/H+ antiporter NhaD/arsenite permease-like protein
VLTDPVNILSAAAGGEISLLWSIPFVLLLLCTALTPLFSIKFWHHHYAKFAIGFGLITAVYYLVVRREPGPWLAEMKEYVSFIILLGSLYVVSGGIFIRISRVATPTTNCVLLLIGAIIANVVGTTGASMLLIRPFLRINRAHVRAYHVVFFIFIVSNCGGLLTPIGDPPLFLGFLQGVPFWWVFYECHTMWFFVIVALLAVFFMIDHLDHRVKRRERPDDEGPAVYVNGMQNFVWIALILYGVFRPGTFDVIGDLRRDGFSVDRTLGLLLSREVLMVAAMVASRVLTPREVYHRNEFNYDAIREVAILFVGIFATMVPALQWLQNNANRMPLERPAQYYFACGGLSAALDNAPTYLTFLQVKLGRLDQSKVDEVYRIAQGMVERRTLNIPDDIPDAHVRAALDQMVRFNAPTFRRVSIDRRDAEIAVLLSDPRSAMALVAISLGAVFFGAMTYIGNGPNFMVKSIAESQGVPTPTFLGYIGKYALPMLLPILIAVWFIFLRGG